MASPASWRQAFLDDRRPMEPTATEVNASLRPLENVRAVIFDVYGTLVISGSGDVGSADSDGDGRDAIMADAIASVWGDSSPDPMPGIEQLQQQIRSTNAARVSDQCPQPEVDIVDVWRHTMADSGVDVTPEDNDRLLRLAASYEAQANPTWPMPGAQKLLSELNTSGIRMGIVSNAQFFSPSLVEDLLDGSSLDQGGFDLNCCVFSNRFRHAKPGPKLFDVLRNGLARVGIAPHEAVYVGNDMLNDIWAASMAGLKTAWFAGDGRSCRPRQNDPRCRSLRPDVVLTDLLQLLSCLQSI
ncbi:dUMP phosphatase [Rubripirellula lacrimiformis]|uniref:dUMP phosphatase n=1 Tax=Rubripirellula lacrimiformis TaxID=1930273 RepID=A0A517N6Q2_9BACT|nr:HAD family hydrolase [Rubripirellula lacrimiformis]QDT02823.1 dUMP phosphatase [Rubripirellula lacrimiformis]